MVTHVTAMHQRVATVYLHYALSLPKQAGTNLSGRGTYCMSRAIYDNNQCVIYL